MILLKITRLKEQGANQEVIARLRMEVESLHQETEQYFKSRGSREAYVKPGKHHLPPLPYAYDALQPYISEEIMRLHHTNIINPM